jgi:hypothetical protein
MACAALAARAATIAAAEYFCSASDLIKQPPPTFSGKKRASAEA